MKEIYKPNTPEDRVWFYHHDGKSIPDIVGIMEIPYYQVKEIILNGWKMQG